MSFSWTRFVALAAIMVPLAPGVAVVAPGAQTPAAAVEGERYVALGDSFVAGPGIAPLHPSGCQNSARNFPTLVAGMLSASLVDASCGSATLNNLWSPQTRDAYVHPPQLDSVTADTDLVTFGTLGGNDVGIVELAVSCFLEDCAGSPGDARHQAVDALRPTIDRALDDVGARAPGADVVVIGYSTYVPPTSCPSVGAITPAEAKYLQGVVDHLSDVLKRAATAAGAGFADMRALPGVSDHTVCAPPAQQWVRGVETYDDGAPLHPSTCGMAAYAQQVRRAVQELRGEQPTAFVDPCPEGLKEAAASTRLVGRCAGDRVSFVLRGGKGLVTKVVVRLGSKRIATDSSAPFRVVRPVRGLAAVKGAVRASVLLRRGDARMVHRINAPRPRCLR